MRTSRMWLPLLVVALLACGDDDPVAPTPAPLPTVDDALVGTWVGPIQGTPPGGTQVSGTMTMNLNADGSMSVAIDNPAFHPINNGTWSVSGSEFSASGADTEGTVVSFLAPRSTTQLEGTFNAGAGNGTFVVTKQ